MPNINTRLFGSDIPNIIKKKLEARQLAASASFDPNSEIISDYRQVEDDPFYQGSHFKYKDLLKNTDGEAHLDSRTPFVRLWCGVEISEREISVDKVRDLTEKGIIKQGKVGIKLFFEL